MNKKSKKIGYALAFLLGVFGAHAFYYQRYARGSFYFLFSWTLLPVIIGWIDMFSIHRWHIEWEQKEKQKNRNTNTTDSIEGNKSKLRLSPTTSDKEILELEKNKKQTTKKSNDHIEVLSPSVGKNVPEKEKVESRVQEFKVDSEMVKETTKITAKTYPTSNESQKSFSKTYSLNAIGTNQQGAASTKDTEPTVNHESAKPIKELLKALELVILNVEASTGKEAQQTTEDKVLTEGEVIAKEVHQEEKTFTPETLEVTPAAKPISTNVLDGTDKTRKNLKQRLKDSFLGESNPNQKRNKIGLKSKFYNEETVILPKYRELKTPKEIIESLESPKQQKTHTASGIKFQISFGSSSVDKFIADSLKYSKEKGTPCTAIPLHAYWTTYDDLDTKQKQWYFYWREQVLNGTYPDTDLSYIILFAYELINYTFNQKASFNVSMMVLLFENYLERERKVANYLPHWIRDMLLELGEEELAMEFSDEILNPALNVPPLYMRMQEKQDDITKVSMTSWNSHINNFRKTDFFIKHRNQIYKTFKEGLLLLQERYNKENVTLLDRFFTLKEESLPINLFGSASPLIKRTRQPLLIKEKRIKPTERLTLEITALLRLSENVIRLRNGVKQQIKVDEDVLPGGFKTELLERMALVEKAVNKRFKTVQKPEPSQGAGHIPAPPDDTSEVTSFPETKPRIEFNMENIKNYQEETDNLIKVINARGGEDDEENDEVKVEAEEVQPVVVDKGDKVEPSPRSVERVTPMSILDAFGGSGGSVDGENDFVAALSTIEKEFMLLFTDGLVEKTVAQSYLKQKGMMLGTFLSELNEKADEHLGDNIIEHQGDELAIYEEYEHVTNILKETV